MILNDSHRSDRSCTTGPAAYSRRDGHATRNYSALVDSMANGWHSDALPLKEACGGGAVIEHGGPSCAASLCGDDSGRSGFAETFFRGGWHDGACPAGCTE